MQLYKSFDRLNINMKGYLSLLCFIILPVFAGGNPLADGYYQRSNPLADGYIQDVNPLADGYIQRTNPLADGYVQDINPLADGYIQDMNPLADGYVILYFLVELSVWGRFLSDFIKGKRVHTFAECE
mgnify:CR=1 FL=1